MHHVLRVGSELGVCKETVRRLVRRKVLRKLPGLRRILIPRAEVQRYLEAGEGGLAAKTLKKWPRKNLRFRKSGGPSRI